MRPLHLVIQAFGPFAERVEIDFTRLGANPLFLINGPTGAGKSSILDAMCFALYGHTTGSEREATQMRCDYADVSLLTEVTLTFRLGEKRYRITRVPTQERPKARGEGTTTQQTYAQLLQLTEEGEQLLVPKGALEATREIENLTGLTVEQFRQVMVLPQGKFREFLLADSQQREAIFGRLFQTQIYKRLEEALKAEAAGIRRDVEALHNQIHGLLGSVDCASEAALEAELAAIEPQRQDAAESKAAAQTRQEAAKQALTRAEQLAERFDALRKLEDKQQRHAEQAQAVQRDKQRLAQAQKAGKLVPLRARVQELQRAKSRLESQVAASEQALHANTEQLQTALTAWQQAEHALAQVEALRRELDELKRWLPKIDKLTEADTEVNQRQQAAKRAQSKLAQSEEFLAQLKTQQKRLEGELAELQTVLKALPECQRQLEDLETLGKKRARADKAVAELARWQSECASGREALLAHGREVTEAQRQLKRQELDWHRDQAAILAQELQLGEPCPVCGSLEHPSPARLRAHAGITREAIDAAKEQLERLQLAQSEANNRLAAAEANRQQLEAAIAELKEELGTNWGVASDELRNHWKALSMQLQTLKHQQQLEPQVQAKLQQTRAEREQAEVEHVMLQQQWQSDEQQRLLAEQDRDHLLRELPEAHRDREQLRQSIESLQEKIAILVEAHRRAQAVHTDVNQQQLQLRSALNEQRKQLGELQQNFEQAQASWQLGLTAEGFASEPQFDEALLTDAEQEKISQSITRYLQEAAGLEATLAHQREQLTGQSVPDRDGLREALLTTTNEAQAAEASWRALDKRFSELTSVQAKLRKAQADNAELDAQYRVIGTLSEVASGQTGSKISLQRFVLSVLLDDVLLEASERLHVMSKGRYRLLRKEDRTKGNRASGLELEVDDAYTGKARAVATLSGGESFMAALALALGLSDVVQAYAGGIRLETLFVDEGFGSLDPESLDLAIRTLVDLQSGGRMIGIISHVTELREQMPLRVDVIAGKHGSRIEVVGPVQALG